MRAAADSQIQLRQNAGSPGGSPRRSRSAHPAWKILVVPQNAPVVDNAPWGWAGLPGCTGYGCSQNRCCKAAWPETRAGGGAGTSTTQSAASVPAPQARPAGQAASGPPARPSRRWRRSSNSSRAAISNPCLVFQSLHSHISSGRTITLPAELAGSWGCAWCGGRYSSTAPRARGL